MIQRITSEINNHTHSYKVGPPFIFHTLLWQLDDIFARLLISAPLQRLLSVITLINKAQTIAGDAKQDTWR